MVRAAYVNGSLKCYSIQMRVCWICVTIMHVWSIILKSEQKQLGKRDNDSRWAATRHWPKMDSFDGEKSRGLIELLNSLRRSSAIYYSSETPSPKRNNAKTRWVPTVAGACADENREGDADVCVLAIWTIQKSTGVAGCLANRISDAISIECYFGNWVYSNYSADLSDAAYRQVPDGRARDGQKRR